MGFIGKVARGSKILLFFRKKIHPQKKVISPRKKSFLGTIFVLFDHASGVRLLQIGTKNFAD